MRVLLLNPPGPFCRAGSRWPHSRKQRSTGIDYHPFPFSLGYAASRLRADGHEVRFVDCIADDVPLDALLEIAEEFKPEIVFMETSAPSFHDDTDTVQAIRSRFHIPCIAGGAHASATCEEHLEAGFAAVIRGEYDQIISQAVTLQHEPWLATPDSPEADYAPLVQDLDSIPWPAWDLMPMEKYNDAFCLGRSVTVLSSRGCTHRCEFCTLAHFHGSRSYRMRSPQSVCEEVEELVKRYTPNEVYFDDDSITLNRKHILALCDEYKRRGINVPFTFMGHATADREILEAMVSAGCRAYKFGVESADPEVLSRIPKQLNLDHVVRTVRDCRELGILTHATYLFGLPGETRERAMKTIDFALRLGTHTLQFAIVTPYPGTALYDRAKQNDWLIKDDWRDFDPAGGCVLSYPGYSNKDIEAMLALAFRRWYLHLLFHQPSTILHHFKSAWRREGLGGMLRLTWFGITHLLSYLKPRR